MHLIQRRLTIVDARRVNPHGLDGSIRNQPSNRIRMQAGEVQVAHCIGAALRRSKICGGVGPSPRKPRPNQQDGIGRNRTLLALGALQVIGGHTIVAILVSLRCYIDDHCRSKEPFHRDLFHRLTALILSTALWGAPALATDPLPAWNDGPAKKSIVEFVEKVTAKGSRDFVPEPGRIAVFDNDGTLWAEQPLYFQLAFALDRVKVLAPQHPEWKE